MAYAARERVKRCGKSAPVAVATPGAVRIMGCKAKYILVLRHLTEGETARFAESVQRLLTEAEDTGRGRLHDRFSDEAAR